MTPYESARTKVLAFSAEEKQAILSNTLSFSDAAATAFSRFAPFSAAEQQNYVKNFGLNMPAMQSAIEKIQRFTPEEKRALVASHPRA